MRCVITQSHGVSMPQVADGGQGPGFQAAAVLSTKWWLNWRVTPNISNFSTHMEPLNGILTSW